MKRALVISCIVFGVMIIITSIILVVLQIAVKITDGPPGIKGGVGKPEPDVTTSNAILLLNSINFASPGGFTIFQNSRLKIITSGFTLTSLMTLSLLPTNTIPLFQLTPGFIPTFQTGAIGMIFNTLNVTENHILLYDKSTTPNVSFLVRSAFLLQPSDRFVVNLFFSNS
jgi:hypothetical protein